MPQKKTALVLHFSNDEQLLVQTNEMLLHRGAECISIVGADPLTEVLGIISPDIIIIPLAEFINNIPENIEEAEKLFSGSHFLVIGKPGHHQTKNLEKVLAFPNVELKESLDYLYLQDLLEDIKAESRQSEKLSNLQIFENRMSGMRDEFLKSLFQRSLRSIYYFSRVSPEQPADDNMELVVRNWHTIAGTAHIFSLNEVAQQCEELEAEAEAIFKSKQVSPERMHSHFKNAISFIDECYSNSATKASNP